MITLRTYTELIELPTFLDRYRYLRIPGRVGEQTFETGRWFNQHFYRSNEWKDIRREVILRDGFDLADPEHPFGPGDAITIHHMNPIELKDIREHTDILLNPEYLIACTTNTHRAIHFGDESMVTPYEFNRRAPNDTSPWRNQNDQRR